MIKYAAIEEMMVADIERMTITLPSEMAAIVKGAVEAGEYASNSEVFREALRDWKVRRTLQLDALNALKVDIERGLTDVAEGRLHEFDRDQFIERGRRLLTRR